MGHTAAVTATCPRCRAILSVPGDGAAECSRCRLVFELTLAFCRSRWVSPPERVDLGALEQSPAPPRGISGELPLVETPCSAHPTNWATRTCERCGDFICNLCTTAVEGRAYCPQCFELLYERGALRFVQQRFTLPGLSLLFGAASLLSCGFGFPFGIAGVISGVRALREIGRRPELQGRGAAIAGIALSVASFLAVAGFAGFVAFRWLGR